MKKSKWNELEIALLVLLAVCLLTGAMSLRNQDVLQQKMIRLHVVANSDSDRDQTLKLQVRDKVLAFTEQTMRASASREEANNALREALPQIKSMAEDILRENDCSDSVEARLEPAEFPLKAYDGFRLPAGEYMALRVLIGEAAGQNWWCVVYPPLCMAAASDVRETGIACGMEQEELSLMQEENETYQVKFRFMELWEQLRQWLGKESRILLKNPKYNKVIVTSRALCVIM